LLAADARPSPVDGDPWEGISARAFKLYYLLALLTMEEGHATATPEFFLRVTHLTPRQYDGALDELCRRGIIGFGIAPRPEGYWMKRERIYIGFDCSCTHPSIRAADRVLDAAYAAAESRQAKHARLGDPGKPPSPPPQTTRKENSHMTIKPTRVFDTFLTFAVERQNVFVRKAVGARPLTHDPILAGYKFTCPYRAADRTSQYLIRNVIYAGDPAPAEVVFRTLLFKFFNRIDTWGIAPARIRRAALQRLLG